MTRATRFAGFSSMRCRQAWTTGVATAAVLMLAVLTMAGRTLAQGTVPTPQVTKTRDRIVKVYDVGQKHADEVGKLLLDIFAPDHVQIAVDTRRGALVVAGAEADHERFASTLNSLMETRAKADAEDKAREQERSKSLLVRVLWFSTTDKAGAKLPDDLTEVAAAIERHISPQSLRLTSQMMINVEPGQDFNAQGQIASGPPIVLSVDGQLNWNGNGEEASLSVLLAAKHPEPQGQGQLFDIRTSITAPIGHMVVLGMVPSRANTEVLVVQVLNPQDLLTKPTAKGTKN